MKMRLHHVALVLFVCILASCTTEPVEVADTNSTEAENVTEVEKTLFQVVNDHRTSLGMSPLEFSSTAYAYANEHTDYMIAKGSLSHDNFNTRASKITTLEKAEMVAENVAKEYSTAVAAFEGWLRSYDHKSTMEGDFTHTAVSVKKNEQGVLYFTQLFYR